MEIMSGSKALMVALEKEGVKQVFGLPGGANLPMYDELYKSNIRHILVRHEQSAAHMADGFGRVSRKAGVCFATSGPGATNIITGLATAQADSAPMIAVTGQVPVKMIGRDAFQESDIIGISNPIVKYAFQPREPKEIPEVIKKRILCCRNRKARRCTNRYSKRCAAKRGTNGVSRRDQNPRISPVD